MFASFTIDSKGRLKRSINDKMDVIGDKDSGENKIFVLFKYLTP